MSKKQFQDIFTSVEMVNELLDHIPLKTGDKVLEPTAGSGNMIEPMLIRADGLNITAVEIQSKYVKELIERFKDREDVVVTEAKQKPKVSSFDVFFKETQW